MAHIGSHSHFTESNLDLLTYFNKYKLLFIPNPNPNPHPHPTTSLTLTTIRNIVYNLNPDDLSSFGLESCSYVATTNEPELPCPPITEFPATFHPADFFADGNTQSGYVSFILQNDVAASRAAQLLCYQLPINKNTTPTPQLHYSDALWFFCGRNNHKTRSFSGRGKHTDEISHAGTCHSQVLGSKLWKVSPTKELIDSWGDNNDDDDDDININCSGDESEIEMMINESEIIFLNTRLWYHETRIPPQPGTSVSIARDLHLGHHLTDNFNSGETFSNV